MNNEEKNTYAKTQLKNATIKLLKDYDLCDISIGLISETAQVSRNAFYRNYNTKEEIITEYISDLIHGWQTDYQKENHDSNSELYGSLFKHLYDQKGFYLLLKKRNLFHLFLSVMISLFGPKPEYDNMAAYTTAFVSYGTYGWIEEWIARGMQESADVMTALLTANGMK
ncbi:TetR/AcrR family transcriptional regulator [Lachnospira pectinoschiza]|uniref:Transcriptional regulator, TetR family n=1 Tax=Lachnospira pectinoschiza TaxID=28052 RepID=A0A1G9TP19_9FIRM|nr:TetR/AcrR family transcriptional regulator [Lachnospira pectinoschiza]SDM48845.1 transcriptional regulator, TetR family [Lachnospira pectinoschiza]